MEPAQAAQRVSLRKCTDHHRPSHSVLKTIHENKKTITYKWAENLFIVLEGGQFPTVSAGAGPSPLPLGYRSSATCLDTTTFLYIALSIAYSTLPYFNLI